MDLQHTYEVYQKQWQNIRQTNGWGKPNVLSQFRRQYQGFDNSEIELLKSFLADNNTKWFVANLISVLDSFPEDLLRPILTAATDEPDPSLNNEFVKPCRRVFSYLKIQNILLDLFTTGNKTRKIGVLKVFYWARPTVYEQHIISGDENIFIKGKEKFHWDEEAKIFDDTFVEDIETFNWEFAKQQEFYIFRTLFLIREFEKSQDMELRYHLSLRLADKIENFPPEIEKEASRYLKLKLELGTPTDILEFEKVEHINSPVLRRSALRFFRLLRNKNLITLKHR
jgi:hypothetical protein